MKKLVALLLAMSLCLGLLAGCGNSNGSSETESTAETTAETTQSGETTAASSDSYTFYDYAEALGNNWNPHTWEVDADDAIMSLINSPFVNIQILDSENGVYQWVYEMATSVTDVTAEHQDDLTKYGVTLQDGMTAEETTEGFVFEIALNPDAKWENGEAITADDYIYSMQQLLAPEMKNYRANLYIAGESALAGAMAYYYSGSTAWIDTAGAYAIADLVQNDDGAYATADGQELRIAPTASLEWLGGNSLQDYVDAYGDSMFDVASFEALLALADETGYVPVTDESLELLVNVITFSPDWGETAEDACNYLTAGVTYDEVDYDSTVGCYKVDDYTIRYVNQQYIDMNYFMTSLTSTWLVYEDLYEAGKDTSGELVTTDYGTSVDTTMAYGPYRMESFQADRQVVFVRNENWYGWEDDGEGGLVSYTPYEVDGQTLERYQSTRVCGMSWTPTPPCRLSCGVS